MARTLMFLLLNLLNPFMIYSTPLSGFLHKECSSPPPSNFDNSTYQRNLQDATLDILDQGDRCQTCHAYNVTRGEYPVKVHAVALCRGDISNFQCDACLKTLFRDQISTDSCTSKGKTDGNIWYAECVLRYANSPISRVFEPSTAFVYNWSDSGSGLIYPYLEPVSYTELKNLLSGLVKEALGSRGKFAVGEGKKVFASVQCDGRLSADNCESCLATAFARTAASGVGTQGFVLLPSCFLIYDAARFYNVSALSDELPTKYSLSTLGIRRQGVIFAIGLATFAAVLTFICTFGCLRFQRPAHKKLSASSIFSIEDEVDYQAFQFPYDIIRSATEDFNVLLGKGGFGPVYKGRLPHGEEIAVKKLSPKSTQGDREFGNEVRLLAKIQHRNLVKLHGFSLQKKERLLVYEYLPNRSLDFYLFDPIKRATLDWKKRFKIIRGIARGIMYLHEDSRLKIIHCDLKASNVLLDDGMNARISDFGLAKLFEIDQSYKMTAKFAAPEYAIEGLVSTKTDVYSFGIMVMEIITGEKNSKFKKHEESDSLVSYVWRNWSENSPLETIDVVLLASTLMQYEIKRCIHIALLCVEENAKERPTMTQVVAMLSNCVTELKCPSQPAFTTTKSCSSTAAQFLQILKLAELEKSEENYKDQSD